MIEYHNIRHVHVELTTRCQAQCPGCSRNVCGFIENPLLPDCDMSLEQFQKIFAPEFLAQLDYIIFCGNLGDAALAKDFVPIVQYVCHSAPQIHLQLSTNGSVRNTQWWQQLAQVSNGRLEVWFALDGLEDTHEIYRRNTSWRKIIENACAYIQAGGPAVWQMIPFQHNQHQVKDCIQLSQQLGFRAFKTPAQVRANFPNLYKDGSVIWIRESNLKKPNNAPLLDLMITESVVQQAIQEKVKQFHAGTELPKNISDQQTHTWQTYGTSKLKCQTKKDNSIYIAANGEVYPCCYTGVFPKQMPGLPQIKQLIEDIDNNAVQVGLKSAISWLPRVEQAWKNTVLEPCVNNCLEI
jgi:MoaA/NifB/PqqE/SkfB family radical SAM enzyme